MARDTGTTNVLLLAGGLGTRLRPVTDATPKCLVRIAGRPLLDYWFDNFARAGLREIRINTHHLREQVRSYIAARNASGAFVVSEAYEPVLLGSAGTVHENRDLADGVDDVLIVYADNLSDMDLGAMLDFHHGHRRPATMGLFHTPYPTKCGIAQLDARGVVTEFVEKPAQPKGNLANAGVYAFSANAYRRIADMAKFDLGFDVLPRFVGRMCGWVWNGYHRDIGTLESLGQAEADAPGVFAQPAPGGRP
jgi:mannose-1-phosphate guanylyltransferase